MKGFLKNVFSTIIGVFISGFILISIFFVIIAAIISNKTETYTLEDNTILSIRLEGVLKDKATPNPIMELFDFASSDEMSLSDILKSIKQAKENDKIKGIYINARAFHASNASALEMRDALLDFKKSGKFIFAYADTYLQGCYFIASVADKVIINPQGALDLHGVSASPTFYKGMLDKLGIEVQIFKVGTYKSAVEPFMTDKMSEANKEQVSAFARDIWSTLLAEIGKSRKLSIDTLNYISDQFPMMQEKKFLVEHNLVDTAMYEMDVRKMLAEKVGEKKIENLKLASVQNIVNSIESKSKESNRIAILYAEGNILSGNSSAEINDRYYVREIEKLKNNDKIKAVVFRINSGGGSAYASEQIWKAITDLKAVKPVVVSMGDYAASGGYYIACNASKIIAQPNTLTGSIGIFGMFPNVEGLTKKIGLTFDNVKTNKFSDFGDITRPMNNDEKILLQAYIERGYDLFLTRCADGRGMPKDSLAKIAEGRVWTGNQALKIGLVDKLGGIDTAIEEAVKLAKLEKYTVVDFPEKPNFLEEFLRINKDEIATKAMKEYLGKEYEIMKTIKEIKGMNELDFIQARLPFDFQIK